jgi:hypothetical protein
MICSLVLNFLPVLMLVWTAPVDEPPPEPSQSLLTRFRAQLTQAMDQAPHYSCLATIDRSIRDTIRNKPLVHDRMRIRMAFLGSGEAYAWPDSLNFQPGKLALLARGDAGNSGGLTGWGRAAAGWPESKFSDAGECTFNGQHGTRYDVHVAWDGSSYSATSGTRQLVLPYVARFCVDPATSQPIILEVHAEQLRPPLASISETIVYAHTRIGQSEWLAPQSRELSILDKAGNLQSAITILTDCRPYADATAAESASAAAQPATRSLPAKLTLDMKLDTPITFERSAVGDAVTARLQRTVRVAGIELPKGTLLNGRIGRLEEQFVPEQHYVVGLDFGTIEERGTELRFHARLTGPAVRYDRRPDSVGSFGDPQFMPPIWDARGLEIDSSDPTARLGVFRVRAVKLNIASGLHMIWETLPLE